MEKLNNILDSLYNGNINVNQKNPDSKDYLKILEECNIILKKIENKLDEGDKKLLDRYIENKSEIASIECKEKFIEGYKLATQLIICGIK